MNNLNIIIVCNKNNINFNRIKKKLINYYFIGIENGCIDLIKKKIIIDFACGDFDNLKKINYEKIKFYSNNSIKFLCTKSLIDGEIAIKFALKLMPKKIFFISSGKRFDMILSVLGFIKKYNIVFINDNNYCYLLKKNKKNIIYPKKKYKYLSLMSFGNALLNINGLLYNCKNLKLSSFSSNAISNRFINNNPGIIEVIYGNVILIYTKK